MAGTSCVIVDGKRISLKQLIKGAAAATHVLIYNCPGLLALPDLPAATHVLVDNCPGLVIASAGRDRRGYKFSAIRVRGGSWRVIAGCRNFTPEQARIHWKANPERLALVEKLAAKIDAMSAGVPA